MTRLTHPARGGHIGHPHRRRFCRCRCAPAPWRPGQPGHLHLDPHHARRQPGRRGVAVPEHPLHQHRPWAASSSGIPWSGTSTRTTTWSAGPQRRTPRPARAPRRTSSSRPGAPSAATMRIPDYGDFPPMDCIESRRPPDPGDVRRSRHLPALGTRPSARRSTRWLLHRSGARETRDRRPASGRGLRQGRRRGRGSAARRSTARVGAAVRDRRAVRPGGDQLEAHQPPVHVDDRGSTRSPSRPPVRRRGVLQRHPGPDGGGPGRRSASSTARPLTASGPRQQAAACRAPPGSPSRGRARCPAR